MRPSVAAVTAAVALLASGCGGGGDDTKTTGGPKASAAEMVFVQHCGACHALDAAGTTGTFGGDLDKLRPSRTEVRQAIENGPGTMPEAILSGRDADVVAAYVARVAGR